ncbi:MAG: acyl-CoA thioesterase [Flavobacteriaceae bacterium]
MLKHQINFRVRYCETDQMGFVHHGNYAQYFEMGRIEWLRNFGLSYKTMESEGIALPVVNLQTNFLKPCFYDDLLSLETEISAFPTAKIQFTYKLKREGILVSTGETTLVFVDSIKQRPMKAPDHFMEMLKKKINQDEILSSK